MVIDVKSFIREHLVPYGGDESFLVGSSEKTRLLWKRCTDLLLQESSNDGVLDVDVNTISRVNSHAPGYISKENEVIVGLQTDAPLKRAIKPLGGIRVVERACQDTGYTLSQNVKDIFTNVCKSHNDAVFDAYTPTIRTFRTTGVITGLPDNYARGRIIGDYRRVALYGVDLLIQEKQRELDTILLGDMADDLIRLREEVAEQIKALKLMKEMALQYGVDISAPAQSARDAVQWTYFAYLAALKEHDGAAMSLGNVSSFFDIYIERDVQNGILTEELAQELIDQFVIKLRLVRHLRPKAYSEIFAGDPTWLTESLGGTWSDGTHKVTKTSFRFLQTLVNLGPSPEPNITVLWSDSLPLSFRNFCARISIQTSAIQYENDQLMQRVYGSDDYGISCCVSCTPIGKQMQFFGARCNLPKALLLALNQGKDEIKGLTLVDDIPLLEGNVLQYESVIENLKQVLRVIAKEYVNTMNVIHYMHDKYYYERVQMALIDTKPRRVMAFGIAGLSILADSLSAIKYGHVRVIRNKEGISLEFDTTGEYPCFGNDDGRVDSIAQWVIEFFCKELQKHTTYRDARPTLSVLTITSNVMYGKKTGATPDGRLAGEPFAPGANPVHGRELMGALSSLNSVAKLPYEFAQDGISNTFTIVPSTLGVDLQEQTTNLVSLVSGYFAKGAQHLNVNVLERETLLDAMEHPENYPQLTIRVSGYAVNFVALSKEQQEEVISRTFFNTLGISQ